MAGPAACPHNPSPEVGSTPWHPSASKRYTHPVAGDLAKRMDVEPVTNASGLPPRPADVLPPASAQDH